MNELTALGPDNIFPSLKDKMLNDEFWAKREDFIKKQQQRLFEILADDNSRAVIETFFDDIKLIVEDENAGSIIIGVVRDISNVLNNKNGSQSMKYICDGVTEVLTDETASVTIEIFINELKATIAKPGTAPLINMVSRLTIRFINTNHSINTVNAIEDGFMSFIDLPDNKETIITIFKNLKTFMVMSWTDNLLSFVSLPKSNKNSPINTS